MQAQPPKSSADTQIHTHIQHILLFKSLTADKNAEPYKMGTYDASVRFPSWHNTPHTQNGYQILFDYIFSMHESWLFGTMPLPSAILSLCLSVDSSLSFLLYLFVCLSLSPSLALCVFTAKFSIRVHCVMILWASLKCKLKWAKYKLQSLFICIDSSAFAQEQQWQQKQKRCHW